MHAERELLQRALMSGQHNSSGGRIVAPPLLAAYAQLLAALLPAAHAEELAAGTSGGQAGGRARSEGRQDECDERFGTR